MRLVVVAIIDSAVAAYMRPFFVPSTAVAVRSFRDEVSNPESPMHKHPEDYILFHVGFFDEDSGKFENLPSPIQLARAQDMEVRNASASS